MAIHSSVLAWRVPGTEEPGGLQSMGSQSWTGLWHMTPLPPHGLKDSAYEKMAVITREEWEKIHNKSEI